MLNRIGELYYTYGFNGLLKLLFDKLNTIIFFNSSRIIRRPISIRGKRNINFGNNLTTGIGCRIEAFTSEKKKKIILFGDNVQINDYVHITSMCKVSIGNNVLLASKIYISDCTHGFYGKELNSSPLEIPMEREYNVAEVCLEDNVWIGEFVSVLPGVTIGKGSIIGANSVVTRDIPPNVIAVGSPAKPIKKYNFKNEKWERIY